MIPLYPLRFKPIFKEKIWGGRKLHDFLGKECGNIPNCGESWELSAVEGNVSVVQDGPLKGKRLDHLIHEYRSALVGKDVYSRYKESFPLLIKFLDAQEDLSIQVHPNDELAMERHQQAGKTEMWYILQADKGAKLITGFNRKINREIFTSLMEEGHIEEVLNHEKVGEGDVFFIPAGRIHTIGKGILLAEIQQTSDVTYRIYDFDRKDDKGNKRDLHVDEAADALDYNYYAQYKTGYSDAPDTLNVIVDSPYFKTAKLQLHHPFALETDRRTFRILIMLNGKLSINWKEGVTEAGKGDVFLLPSALNEPVLVPDGLTEALLVTL